MIKIEQKLSMLREKHKHVVYLVTEDRDILQAVFTQMADTLKSFLPEDVSTTLRTSNNHSFFKVAVSNGVLADAYEAFSLKEKDYIPKDFFQETGGSSVGKPLFKNPRIFFVMNDFQILPESKSAGGRCASHFLKQFIAAAKREETEGRFILLFLVSPVLKMPEGFESEVEIIDVPEMDREDIEEFLLVEAEKEFEDNCHQRAYELNGKKQEISPVNLQRIREAAKDFRGVSRRGLQETVADLQAEFGSFFGRAEDKSGTEGNRRKISASRKKKIMELKRNEALHDPTVTILEPQDTVVGMREFLNWVEGVKEEFMDVDKAHACGNEPPKGVLLTGVPGSGKTQAAKSVAAAMGGNEGNVLLVQFRMDNLLGGLVGDSEANFKRCRKRIEALAPCVVLMDEIEKTFAIDKASGKNDVKMNILTALLDWMQENKKQIFFFATSNSVTELKPELLRDGRFDMRFCVFMPTYDELVDILCLHMKRANGRAESAGAGLFTENFDYMKTAKGFINEITAYARAENKNMFYTGANLENLVTQTNRELKKRAGKNAGSKDAGWQKPYGEIAYKEALVETAKGKFSQPYGVTNMKNIVEFWLAAYENQYTNAGELDLVPFTAYNADKCEFQTEKNTNRDRGAAASKHESHRTAVMSERESHLADSKYDKGKAAANEYDRYMSTRLREEIVKYHKEKKNSIKQQEN
jgi:SpoVK/Ycf46/Vps4 family AAA+-type ATPase